MSWLWTFNSNWPFVTLSPSRASISTMRPGSQRNHRDVARNIGIHRAGGLQLRRGVMLARGDHGELLGMIHLEQTAIGFVLHLRRRRRFQLGIGLHLLAAACQYKAQTSTRQ